MIETPIMTALDKYIALQAEILEQLEALKEKIENPEVLPEQINWAHVGDLNRIANTLRDFDNAD